jgi:hypothetical protein
MGRAIDQDNRLEDHDRRLKLLEDAMEELIQTRVHHVDLHAEIDKHEERIREENSDIKNVRAEGVKVEPDEEFFPPAGKRKKTKAAKPRKVESLL